MSTTQSQIKVTENAPATISTEITGLIAGAITCITLILYFMIMKSFNMMESAIAWSMNFVILGAGIFLAFEYYRAKTTLNVDYIPGLILGSITTAVGVFPFAFFIYIFLSQADPALLLQLKDNVLLMGDPISPTRAAFATAIEGICSGVVITFIMMQYLRTGFRRKRNERLMHG